jgi:hypothetical protein
MDDWATIEFQYLSLGVNIGELTFTLGVRSARVHLALDLDRDLVSQVTLSYGGRDFGDGGNKIVEEV